MIKRILSRINFNTEAEIIWNEQKITGPIKNLSLNGLFLVTDKDIPVDEKVTIKISLASTHSDISVITHGVVKRHDDEGIAVQFTDMELDSFIFLRNIMIYNSGNPENIDNEYREFLNWNSSQKEQIE